MQYKALFLDRDGTINEDSGYIFKKEQLVFIPGSLETLKKLQKYYLLYIISNQSGIGKGLFNEKQFNEFNNYFLEILIKNEIKIEGFFYCPHKTEDNCVCKKPSTYFIDKITQNKNIDIKNSYAIGDHPHDIQMGKNAGTKTIYLLSGHGKRHLGELNCSPDYICSNLFEAAKIILKDK